MTLLGACLRCTRSTVRLWYSPERPIDEQTRPSLCRRCLDDVQEKQQRRREAAASPTSPNPYPPLPDDGGELS